MGLVWIMSLLTILIRGERKKKSVEILVKWLFALAGSKYGGGDFVARQERVLRLLAASLYLSRGGEQRR